MRVEVVGIGSLSKLIDALTSKIMNYEIKIIVDSYQCDQESEHRAFMVEIDDINEIDEAPNALDEQFAKSLKMCDKLGIKE